MKLSTGWLVVIDIVAFVLVAAALMWWGAGA